MWSYSSTSNNNDKHSNEKLISEAIVILPYTKLSLGIPCNLRVPFRNAANDLTGAASFSFQFSSIASSDTTNTDSNGIGNDITTTTTTYVNTTTTLVVPETKTEPLSPAQLCIFFTEGFIASSSWKGAFSDIFFECTLVPPNNDDKGLLVSRNPKPGTSILY